MTAHRRHDISDALWEKLEPNLPGSAGSVGSPAKDNRSFINGVFWILRTGAPWRDLPSDYGDSKNIHRRFCRWRDRGVWERLLEMMIDEPYECLMQRQPVAPLLHPRPRSTLGPHCARCNRKCCAILKDCWIFC